MGGRVHIGTSGFAYADWRPRFYPEGLAQAKFLQHYATRLRTVEINYTFQRFPTESLLAGWAAKVPEDFRFALKLPRRITHERRLRECAEDLARFCAAASTLGDRLGPLLAQTPPALAADEAALREFVAAIPPGFRVAMEFRHPSWDTDSVRAILGGAGVASVIVEDDKAGPVAHRTSNAFAYARMRAGTYDTVGLERWRDLLVSPAGDGLDVYCYLRHDQDGSNGLAAETLAGMFAASGEA